MKKSQNTKKLIIICSALLTITFGLVLLFKLISNTDSDIPGNQSIPPDNSPSASETNGYIRTPQRPSFSIKGGIYENPMTIELSATDGAVIHYTTNYTIPTKDSPVYSEPISIDKTTVISAVSIKNGRVSKPETNTYLMGVSHELDVVSLVIDPNELYNEDTGIYVIGKNPGPDGENANMFQDWERPGHIEFYDKNNTQGFSLNVGIKIFGFSSRIFQQKSFAIMTRNKYDDAKIEYPLFEDKPDLTSFKSIVLRNAGQDHNQTRIKDALTGKLFSTTNVDYQAYRPSVVYLNGEYWGIYNIREKINEHFIADNNGIADPSTVNIIDYDGSVKAGNDDGYTDLVDYIKQNDLSQSVHYEYVNSKLDIDSFIDMTISHIYADNFDYEFNVRFWKEQGDNNKWKCISYDHDLGMEDNPDSVMILDYMINYFHRISWSDTPLSQYSVMVTKLLRNPDFKTHLIDRMDYLLKNELSAENVLPLIDSMSAKISAEMPADVDRWKIEESPNTMENWTAKIEALKEFARKRPEKLIVQARNDLKNVK